MRALRVSQTSAALSAAGILLLAALLPAPAVALGFHGEQEAQKREITRLEYQWRAAQLTGDVPALDDLLAEDYVGMNLTGQIHTKSQLLRRLSSKELTLTQLDLHEIRVKLLGDVAVAKVRAAVQGTSQGRPLLGTFRYTRIYHRLPSGDWKITNFEATRVPSRHQNIPSVTVIKSAHPNAT